MHLTSSSTRPPLLISIHLRSSFLWKFSAETQLTWFNFCCQTQSTCVDYFAALSLLISKLPSITVFCGIHLKIDFYYLEAKLSPSLFRRHESKLNKNNLIKITEPKIAPSEFSRIQICIVSKDALDLFFHPSLCAHFLTPSIFFPMQIQRGSPVDLT